MGNWASCQSCRRRCPRRSVGNRSRQRLLLLVPARNGFWNVGKEQKRMGQVGCYIYALDANKRRCWQRTQKLRACVVASSYLAPAWLPPELRMLSPYHSDCITNAKKSRTRPLGFFALLAFSPQQTRCAQCRVEVTLLCTFCASRHGFLHASGCHALSCRRRGARPGPAHARARFFAAAHHPRSSPPSPLHRPTAEPINMPCKCNEGCACTATSCGCTGARCGRSGQRLASFSNMGPNDPP
jgi:hypothetical protein